MKFAQACLASLLISSTAAAQTTLVAHYRLDETSGTVAVDSSGNGNDGTYTGAGVMLGQAGICAASTSVDFDGVDGHVAIPSSPSLDALSSDFTVASWVNLDVNQLMRIFGNQRLNGVGGSWSYGPLGGGGIRFTTLGVQDYNQASSVVTGVWHHIAVVFDANLLAHFYLDGALQGSIPGALPANAPNSGWFIGVLDLTFLSEFFDGRIDDVQVYSGSATAADMLFLFQNPCSVLGIGTIGTNYCGPAIPNSTGLPGMISACGSTGVGANDVTLTASDLTADFGYFLNSMTQGFFNPPASNGILCLAGSIGRHNQPGLVQQGPSFSITLDLTMLPQPTMFVAVNPGETWNFQAWYRDTGSNNFTDGVSILFF